MLTDSDGFDESSFSSGSSTSRTAMLGRTTSWNFGLVAIGIIGVEPGHKVVLSSAREVSSVDFVF